VNLVGGDLAIESAPHKGASIHVRVPLPHPSANG
jgi:signal transduction histidine kinase